MFMLFPELDLLSRGLIPKSVEEVAFPPYVAEAGTVLAVQDLLRVDVRQNVHVTNSGFVNALQLVGSSVEEAVRRDHGFEQLKTMYRQDLLSSTEATLMSHRSVAPYAIDDFEEDSDVDAVSASASAAAPAAASARVPKSLIESEPPAHITHPFNEPPDYPGMLQILFHIDALGEEWQIPVSGSSFDVEVDVYLTLRGRYHLKEPGRTHAGLLARRRSSLKLGQIGRSPRRTDIPGPATPPILSLDSPSGSSPAASRHMSPVLNSSPAPANQPPDMLYEPPAFYEGADRDDIAVADEVSPSKLEAGRGPSHFDSPQRQAAPRRPSQAQEDGQPQIVAAAPLKPSSRRTPSTVWVEQDPRAVESDHSDDCWNLGTNHDNLVLLVPRGKYLRLHDGTVFYASTMDAEVFPGAVFCRPPGSRLFRMCNSGRAGDEEPACIDLALPRPVWTTSAVENRVIGSNGEGDGEFKLPYGVAVNRLRHELFVCDQNNHRVQVFSLTTGQFVRSFGKYGGGHGEFNFPDGIALIPNACGGLVAVADKSNHRIQIFSCEGKFIRAFGGLGSGASQFHAPRGLAYNPTTQELLVAEACNHRVHVVDLHGGFRRTFGSAGSDLGKLKYPTGICVNAERGEVLVSDRSNDRIQVFSLAGEPLRMIGAAGRRPGNMHTPLGVDVNSKGQIVVADYDNKRVQLLDERGEPLDTIKVRYPTFVKFVTDKQIVCGSYGDNNVQLLTFDVNSKKKKQQKQKNKKKG